MPFWVKATGDSTIGAVVAGVEPLKKLGLDAANKLDAGTSTVAICCGGSVFSAINSAVTGLDEPGASRSAKSELDGLRRRLTVRVVSPFFVFAR